MYFIKKLNNLKNNLGFNLPKFGTGGVLVDINI